MPSSRDPLAEPRSLDAVELATLLWPVRAEGRWVPLPGEQRLALEELVVLLLEYAETGELDRRARRSARSLALAAKVELSAVEVGGVSLWLVSESADRVRGAGAYLIRLGPTAPLVLSAPHVFHDQGTGDIALALLLEARAPSSTPRAIFVNDVHRHRQLDGRKIDRRDNPADSAHAHEHPLAATTRRVLERLPLAIIQLHGYGGELLAGEPVAILSSGGHRPSRYVRNVAISLRRGLPELPIGLYGVDADRLGGTTNIQAQAARELGRCFLHVELSRPLRDRLVAEPDLRARWGPALLRVPEEPSDCR
ncbi:hypothetical protein ACNOYE_27245 [Nannocystaceae bacterium ST9]